MKTIIKILNTFILILAVVVVQPAYTVPVNSFHSYQVDKALELVLRFDEAQLLWDSVHSKGPIEVLAFASDDPFDAYWEGNQRRIFVNLTACPTLDQQLVAILFELHNAQADSQLRQMNMNAYHGQVSAQDYVVGMERIEYDNMHSAYQLLERGKRRGVYPREAFLPCFSSFEECFAMQQQYGHADFHRQNYWRLQQ